MSGQRMVEDGGRGHDGEGNPEGGEPCLVAPAAKRPGQHRDGDDRGEALFALAREISRGKAHDAAQAHAPKERWRP